MSTTHDDDEPTAPTEPPGLSEPPEPDEAPDGREGRRRPIGPDRSSWRRGIALLLVLAAAAAAGVWGLTQGSSDPDPLSDPREVAREFGAAYLTFDSGNVTDLGDRLLALGTEDFVREYESARLPGVEELFTDSDVETRAEVSDVFTTGIDDDRVRALVFVDVDARGPDGEQRLQNLSFVLELEAVEGEWLVDAVAPLPVPEVVGDGVPTTTTPGDAPAVPDPTTTAPAPTTTAPATTAPAPAPAPAG
ncbi:MAG TPA: hypothetical protein VGE43_06735 [Acidimicrobiales bacterium]